jgi:hypothetical protein
MIGLIILIVGAIYLAVLVVVTRAAYRWAKNKGFSKAKCRLAAVGGFLVVYLPVFWDHIPTLITHQYYCSTEAGFWAYKTPEQWKAENPGLANMLTWTEQAGRRATDSSTSSTSVYMNERFSERHSQRSVAFLPVTIYESVVIDSQSGATVLRQVAVGAGYGNMMVSTDWRSMKFWLGSEVCYGAGINGMNAYNPVREGFKRIGSQK